MKVKLEFEVQEGDKAAITEGLTEYVTEDLFFFDEGIQPTNIVVTIED